MKQKLYTLLTILCFCISMTSCSSKESRNIAPEKVIALPEDQSEESISKELGSTPSSKETNKESGISANNYENSSFAGYEGKLSFYYDEDGSVLYYKWFITEKDEKKAKEIYSDVCQALSGSYGDGEENNSEASGLYTTSFTNDKQQITAQLQKANGGGYEISYMVVG